MQGPLYFDCSPFWLQPEKSAFFMIQKNSGGIL